MGTLLFISKTLRKRTSKTMAISHSRIKHSYLFCINVRSTKTASSLSLAVVLRSPFYCTFF